jgi:drug/metabolite transporter (DMT)-like permease
MFSVPLQAILLSVVIHTLWGGNPVAAKFGLEVFPPAWSALIRFVLGIITIALWCWYRGHRLWPERPEWMPIITIGSLFTVQIWLMNMGFDRTTGINAAIFISTNPLFAAVFAHLLLQNDRLTPLRTAGLLVAFVGVCMTLVQRTGGGFSFGNAGDWLCIFSAALLGYRLIVSASHMQRVEPFRLAVWQMLFSLPFYLLLGVTTESILWEHFSYSVVLGLLYQGVVVAGFGFMASLWLISRYRPSVMAGYNFLAPVSGVVLAALMLGESLSLMVVLGTTMVAIGMVLITLRS